MNTEQWVWCRFFGICPICTVECQLFLSPLITYLHLKLHFQSLECRFVCFFPTNKSAYLSVNFSKLVTNNNVPNYFQEKNIGIKISDNFGH